MEVEVHHMIIMMYTSVSVLVSELDAWASSVEEALCIFVQVSISHVPIRPVVHSYVHIDTRRPILLFFCE